MKFKADVANCKSVQGSLKRLMAAALPAVAATALFLSVASPASAGVGIDITIAPPAPKVIVAPAPRAGYVWAPGYWRWDGGRHVWVDGRWMRERRHFHWVAEHWDEGRHGHYHFVPGHWVHN